MLPTKDTEPNAAAKRAAALANKGKPSPYGGGHAPYPKKARDRSGLHRALDAVMDAKK